MLCMGAGQNLLCAYMADAVMTSTIAVAASTATQFPLMSHRCGRLYSLCSMAWLLLLILVLLAAADACCALSALLRDALVLLWCGLSAFTGVPGGSGSEHC